VKRLEVLRRPPVRFADNDRQRGHGHRADQEGVQQQADADDEAHLNHPGDAAERQAEHGCGEDDACGGDHTAGGADGSDHGCAHAFRRLIADAGDQ
jgi:hypothetical protein